MERLFVAAQNYINLEKNKTRFIALRYGNVFGSSGSVFPKFLEKIKNNEKIPITDPQMTRFTLTMDEALDFILSSTELGHGSEIFVPKLKAYSIMDLKNSLKEIFKDNNIEEEIIGVREGEKLHELLLNTDEIPRTWDYKDRYIIEQFNLFTDSNIEKNYPGIKKLNSNLKSISSEDAEKLSIPELTDIISNSGFLNS